MLGRLNLYPLPGFFDPVSSISHLFGALLFALLTPSLLRRGRGSPVRVAYLGVFAFSLVFLFSMSAVYHMLPLPSGGRAVMLRLDYSAIFVLIAGTFTPAHGILFRGPLRWAPLLLMWTAAITGLTLKTIFLDYLPEWLGLTFYLALGWVGSFSALLLWRRYGLRFIAPLLWGAVAYTVGSVTEFLGWVVVVPGIVGPHELMHVLVLVGASCHWRFVWQFAAGEPQMYRATAADTAREERTPLNGEVREVERARDRLARG